MQPRFQAKSGILLGLNEIGQELALGLAREGAKIGLGDPQRSRLDQASQNLSQITQDFLAIECDPLYNDQVVNLVNSSLQRFGKLDFLVYNNWHNKLCKFEQMDEDTWNEVLNSNLRGAFYLCRAAVPHLKKQRYGKILSIVSLAGYSGSGFGEVHFCTAHAALMGFMRCLSRELGGSKINVNTIVVGGVDVPSIRQLYPQDAFSRLKSLISIGRFGDAQDVVPLAALPPLRSSKLHHRGNHLR